MQSGPTPKPPAPRARSSESGTGGAATLAGARAAPVPRVTVHQVAALAGVSTATVSRALAGTGAVSEALRRRVADAAVTLQYRPNRAARSLRIRRSLTVGVLIPDIQNFFFTGIVRGLEHVLHEAGYTYLLGNSDGRAPRERLFIDTLRDEGAAGFIIVPSERGSRAYRALQEAGIPIVMLDRSAPGLNVDQVTVTNQEGVRAAVQHLIALGHRRIGYISGPSTLNVARERLAGYEQALQQAGLPIDPSLVRPGDFQQVGGLTATEALLNVRPRPTAMFVANNLMTLGAFEALHRRRMGIPDQMAIVGFDDLPWATSLQPPLTAVAQPTYELGVAAAQLLLARLQNPGRPFRRVVLDTALIVRGSCGAGARRS
jgi:LacI family transcriptional regulator